MQNYKSNNISHEVLKYLQKIPRGKVTTYKHLAEKFSLHPRVVANILKNNKQQDIFPCYRVVRSDGSLGGYNLGIDLKIKKLKEDGVEITNFKVDLKKHGWFDE